jgi:flagellar protein FlaI
MESYEIPVGRLKVGIEIARKEGEFVPIYVVKLPKIETGTLVLLDEIRGSLVTSLKLRPHDVADPHALIELKEKFYKAGLELLKKRLPKVSVEKANALVTLLVHETLGLGNLEILLADGNLEEIVINSSKEPVWVYHKKHGWLKTNIIIPTEAEIEKYAAAIGRRVGRQITTLNPLMDAHLLPTGDRVNATLFPISTQGNTLTIRKFRRIPWTITDFIGNKTISADIAALLWMLIEYEMSIIVSGGTASGKTSLLNTLMPFIPPNHRVISIEDTRELNLPEFLHWVPLTTRSPSPEGKGGVSMLDLLVNSLRMRPDRIVVGEIRRADEAEVLFEAMHTGHSVYATLHADTAEQTYRRLINPPMSVPEPLLEALDAVVVMFRDRRRGIRRVFEIAELIPAIKLRVLYRWKPSTDTMEKYEESYKLIERLKLFTGMTEKEMEENVAQKKLILEWMVRNKVRTVNGVGKVVSDYYQDPEKVLRVVRKKGSKATDLIPSKWL